MLPGLAAGIGAGVAAGKIGDNLGRRQENIQNRQGNIADRSQNLQDRLGQRQDFRQESREQRQDYLNDRREDWQNWHDDYYGHHDGWYHGAWCDHWGDHWSHMWSEHTAAMVLGTTIWGLNRMSYWFGTSSYYNPYYSEPIVVDNSTINYAEPLAAPPEYDTSARVATPTSSPSLPPGITPEGLKNFEAAQASFRAGDYTAALTAVNKALASMPTDAVMHEFRALVLFALGKYREAAETLHAVLAVGPGWDWTTMSGLYADANEYTKQLRAVEIYSRDHPDEAHARFVVAYHYLILGHNDRAVTHLEAINKLLPGDAVSTQLLTMMGKGPTKSEPVVESDSKIPIESLLGTWTASRGGKAMFEMSLDKDKTFTWTYREGKKEEKVKGVYALDGNVLAMEPDLGGIMLAELTAPQGGTFEFRTVGAPKTDPALKFTKR